jgi:hypothetical protein
MPSQSQEVTCPLLEQLTVDLHRDATSGGDGTSSHLVSVEASVVDLYWTFGNNETSNRLVLA